MWRKCLSLWMVVVAACDSVSRDPEKGAPNAKTAGLSRSASMGQPACDLAPAWTALTEPCKRGGFVYAVGSVAAGMNRGLSYHSVSDRARSALVARGSTSIEDSEVLDIHRCPDKVWGLARGPVSPDRVVAVCTNAIDARSAGTEGCPVWISEPGRLDGTFVLGVGIADRVRNPALARQLAANRAKSEQIKSIRIAIESEAVGDIRTSASDTSALVLEDSEFAYCQGLTVARLKSRVSRSAQ